MNKVVIVVDDSEVIRNIMIKALEDSYEVVSATSGREAIDLVNINRGKDIACMLLDLNMPESNGFVVLDYFRNYHLFKKIPIFIISGDDSKETIDKAFKYDIVDMLNKPFSMENIKSAVERAINLGKK